MARTSSLFVAIIIALLIFAAVADLEVKQKQTKGKAKNNQNNKAVQKKKSAKTTKTTSKTTKTSKKPAKTVGELWKKWKLKNKVNFKTSASEKKRFDVWRKNVRDIAKHNRAKKGFKKGLNKFSALTSKEFSSLLGKVGSRTKPRKYLNSKRSLEEIAQDDDLQEITIAGADDNVQVITIPPSGEQPAVPPAPKPISVKTLPKSVNWKTRGKVGPVRMQGLYCGSCGYHAMIGALESAWAIKRKKLTLLSVQQGIDCVPQHCMGSWGGDIIDWVVKNKGIATAKAYPFRTSKYTSAFTCKKATKFATAKDWVDIRNNYLHMMDWVAKKGPIYAHVNAEPLQNYRGGVLTVSTCPPAENHAVLITGYTTVNGAPVWIVKNSWDTDWGMSGYFYVHRGKTNACGINNEPLGVIV
jgi:C1A family cysteine protease